MRCEQHMDLFLPGPDASTGLAGYLKAHKKFWHFDKLRILRLTVAPISPSDIQIRISIKKKQHKLRALVPKIAPVQIHLYNRQL
ncbi:hypothetical protein GQ55_5G411500 [Panicum hallii var. hallii]|uniref:Uncharacterized protein n=1 Tax=Panicum hallii var. hallii TaxID=1504633 RepID=A0A2T7DNR2_9POAL|nr:hypothetical protein GQ55_5G411500 [Panicum hallii var. hallii]